MPTANQCSWHSSFTTKVTAGYAPRLIMNASYEGGHVMMTYEISTRHGVERVKERCNIKSEAAALRNIERAKERGLRAEGCTSLEREYLAHKEGSTAIAYNNYCYIFSSEMTCITVYPLPKWFGKSNLSRRNVNYQNKNNPEYWCRKMSQGC